MLINNEDLLSTCANIKFISYTGKYPNLCSGVLTLNIEGNSIYYTKYNNPDYEIRVSKYVNQKSIGKVQDYKIVELEEQIERFCNTFK